MTFIGFLKFLILMLGAAFISNAFTAPKDEITFKKQIIHLNLGLTFMALALYLI